MKGLESLGKSPGDSRPFVFSGQGLQHVCGKRRRSRPSTPLPYRPGPPRLWWL